MNPNDTTQWNDPGRIEPLKSMMEYIFDTAAKLHNDFQSRLDAECERVLKALELDIETLTAEKISKMGIVICHYPDSSAEIRMCGICISNRIYCTKILYPDGTEFGK